MSRSERANATRSTSRSSASSSHSSSIAVLGVLIISAEYSTGSIRSTFTAVPKRLPVLWAKLLDYALVSLALMVPAVLVSFFVTQAIFEHDPGNSRSRSRAPGIARCVLMGAGLRDDGRRSSRSRSARSSATRRAASSTFVAIFFVLPPLMNLLPTNWKNTISQYLPLNAGEQMFALKHGVGHAYAARRAASSCWSTAPSRSRSRPSSSGAATSEAMIPA